VEMGKESRNPARFFLPQPGADDILPVTCMSGLSLSEMMPNPHIV